MTRREIIYDIRNSLKQQYQDSILSPVKVWNTFNRKLRALMEQQKKDKKLWQDNTQWKSFCIDLVESFNNECGCIPNNLRTVVYRSKCKLPNIFSTSEGYLIKSLLPVDNNISQEIILTTEISAIRKKKLTPNKMYAFIKDSYLYLLGEVKSISILGLFEELPLEYCGTIISSSNNDSTKDKCNNFLDVEVAVSDYVLEKAILMTLEELMKVFMRSPEIPPINTSPV